MESIYIVSFQIAETNISCLPCNISSSQPNVLRNHHKQHQTHHHYHQKNIPVIYISFIQFFFHILNWAAGLTYIGLYGICNKYFHYPGSRDILSPVHSPSPSPSPSSSQSSSAHAFLPTSHPPPTMEAAAFSFIFDFSQLWFLILTICNIVFYS